MTIVAKIVQVGGNQVVLEMQSLEDLRHVAKRLYLNVKIQPAGETTTTCKNLESHCDLSKQKEEDDALIMCLLDEVGIVRICTDSHPLTPVQRVEQAVALIGRLERDLLTKIDQYSRRTKWLAEMGYSLTKREEPCSDCGADWYWPCEMDCINKDDSEKQ